jgi:DNA-binding PadR family transcriptional regulator
LFGTVDGVTAGPSLTSTSYLVLGILAERGPSTPYELKASVARSIGRFWPFPHTQLYTEPPRLAAAGLVEEEREDDGRRRRRFAVNAAGREALRSWLSEPAEEAIGYRDQGLLKLFFGSQSEAAAIAALADEQADVRRRRLAQMGELADWLESNPGHAFHRRTLELGMRLEAVAIAFWEDVAAEPELPPTG